MTHHVVGLLVGGREHADARRRGAPSTCRRTARAARARSRGWPCGSRVRRSGHDGLPQAVGRAGPPSRGLRAADLPWPEATSSQGRRGVDIAPRMPRVAVPGLSRIRNVERGGGLTIVPFRSARPAAPDRRHVHPWRRGRARLGAARPRRRGAGALVVAPRHGTALVPRRARRRPPAGGAAARAGSSSRPAGARRLSRSGWATLPSGKPMLTFRDGRPQPLHVSVSHGGGLAAAAVCEHGPIGVDVEHVDSRRNLLAIAKRFFAHDEHGAARAVRHRRADHAVPPVVDAQGGRAQGHRHRPARRTDGAGGRAPPIATAGGGWRCDGHDAPLFVRDLRTPDVAVFGAIAIEGQPGVVQSVTPRSTGRRRGGTADKE